MADPEESGTGGKTLASHDQLLYRIEAKDDFLLLHRKFPPATERIEYNKIASVEHKRLVDYGSIVSIAIASALAYLVSQVPYVTSILGTLLGEVERAVSSNIGITGERFGFMLGVFFALIACYYAIKLAMSLGMCLVIYRIGKKPVAFPLLLTGDALTLLATINSKVKEAGGISKVEAEQIVGNQIRSLLEQRSTMQNEMIGTLKNEIKSMKTDRDIARVKKLVHESIDKLESHDRLIDVELKKTGLNKDDIFKKYHLKAPKEEFIDSVLKDEEMENLMEK